MGFLSPNEMAEEYFWSERKKFSESMFLENEMDRYKTEAVKRLYNLTNSNFAEQIAVTIAYAYDNDLKEAEEIVNKLDLCNKHIASLLEDQEKMTEIIFQDTIEEGMYEPDDD